MHVGSGALFPEKANSQLEGVFGMEMYLTATLGNLCVQNLRGSYGNSLLLPQVLICMGKGH